MNQDTLTKSNFKKYPINVTKITKNIEIKQAEKNKEKQNKNEKNTQFFGERH